ncbi:hypothetical protein IVB33_39535 [Bradyrhizobium sp. 24]|uniref:hypothetical protein n=1 Tax=unclassified Bradyrhizobium TaxID=2631580 RepID=UPI001FFBE3E8|nr:MULTISPECIES: hypothetical protein [unclassified Bradyrhizobium]MCK1303423.1 hypothetical protein [Bradyrhizobium sp. 37]MCK1382448.1 hypothetical protein [Bradyrhizobium sp. 24]MCK1770497.1 hypothetical protein [Bradyrhizobium sp. 134]UPJ44604.1 hypothetical protein IVB40_11550 [Bradyrhizobium sp. 40]
MAFNHPNARAVWEAKELTADGIKRVLVLETYLVLTPSVDGHDHVAVSDLLSAANRYLAQNATQLDCVRLFEIKEIG